MKTGSVKSGLSRIRVSKAHKAWAVLREIIFKEQIVSSSVRPCCEDYWPNPFPYGMRGGNRYDKVDD